MAHSLHRPSPLWRPDAQAVDKTTPPKQAAAALCNGDWLCLSGRYGMGFAILDHVRGALPQPDPNASYAERQGARRRYHAVSERLLVPIEGARVALARAPEVGFLAELYPDQQPFMLPFTQVHGLHKAWQTYTEGVHMAVLGYRVHPFYGTYVPTRSVHLELFGTWLSAYSGPRERAVDVGTGCGVLALMLAKAGFGHVLATDTNPNAIESVRRELARLDHRPPITEVEADLLGPQGPPADLIVFNPPWVMGSPETPLDSALVFEEGLFERFFEQAASRLSPSGRVVLVFSNLIQLVQPGLPHPVEAELQRGRFEKVQRLTRKVKPAHNKASRGRSTREKVEVWELRLR